MGIGTRWHTHTWFKEALPHYEAWYQHQRQGVSLGSKFRPKIGRHLETRGRHYALSCWIHHKKRRAQDQVPRLLRLHAYRYPGEVLRIREIIKQVGIYGWSYMQDAEEICHWIWLRSSLVRREAH